MSKRLTLLILSALSILLIPVIAMQFSKDVDWGPMDFAVAAGLLLLLALSIEWVLRKFKAVNHRLIMIILAIIIFLLFWAELAVGIFGTPLSGS